MPAAASGDLAGLGQRHLLQLEPDATGQWRQDQLCFPHRLTCLAERNRDAYESTAGCGPLYEPLDKVHAAAVLIEADHETVVEDPRDRAAGLLAVTGAAGGDRHRTIDGDRAVARIVGAWLVATRRVGRAVVTQPARHHRVTTLNRIVIWVVSVPD